MNAPIQPAPEPALVPDPDARRDAEQREHDERKPGADENAAVGRRERQMRGEDEDADPVGDNVDP